MSKTFTRDTLDSTLRVTAYTAEEHISGRPRIMLGITRPNESKLSCEHVAFATTEAALGFARDILKAVRIAKERP